MNLIESNVHKHSQIKKNLYKKCLLQVSENWEVERDVIGREMNDQKKKNEIGFVK